LITGIMVRGRAVPAVVQSMMAKMRCGFLSGWPTDPPGAVNPTVRVVAVRGQESAKAFFIAPVVVV